MKEGEVVVRRGRSVGKPEILWLRHVLPHCNWGVRQGKAG